MSSTRAIQLSRSRSKKLFVLTIKTRKKSFVFSVVTTFIDLHFFYNCFSSKEITYCLTAKWEQELQPNPRPLMCLISNECNNDRFRIYITKYKSSISMFDSIAWFLSVLSTTVSQNPKKNPQFLSLNPN